MKCFLLALGSDGLPWRRLPRAFVLTDPQEYFLTDTVRRQERSKERFSWMSMHAHNLKKALPPARLGKETDIRAGRETVSRLARVNLTAIENARAVDHQPLSKDGPRTCWDAACHCGCARSPCAFPHQPIGKWGSMG